MGDIAFYNLMGQQAKQNNCKISLLGTKGAGCGLEYLSVAAAQTSGSVNILHPLEMVREIRKIAQNNTVARDASLGVWLDPRLEFKYVNRRYHHETN